MAIAWRSSVPLRAPPASTRMLIAPTPSWRAVLAHDHVVELQEIDAIHAEAREARLQRASDGGPRVALGGVHAKLGAHVGPQAERLQRAAEIALGLAIAVRRRGVEVVDPCLDGPRHRPLALGRRAPNDQSTDVAASEPQRGHAQPRAAQRSLLHIS